MNCIRGLFQIRRPPARYDLSRPLLFGQDRFGNDRAAYSHPQIPPQQTMPISAMQQPPPDRDRMVHFNETVNIRFVDFHDVITADVGPLSIKGTHKR